ncbi:MAG: hypothetical protein HYY24_09830 [Verrucomicrobia bacterium]|nr:hypothetical protein [Verrucomicrobiota bacterium]
MKDLPKSKVPWTHRVLVLLFTLLLGVLFYWLLGFVVKDIGTWPGPAYRDVEKRLVDQTLVERADELQRQNQDVTRAIADQKKRQDVLRDSTSNSERTMTQLLEIQKLALQKGVTPSEAEQKALAESEQLFLANQTQYQKLNETIAELTDRLRDLEAQQRDAAKRLEEQRPAVNEEFNRLQTRHQLKLAAFKLAALLPLLVVAVVLFLKQRTSLYAALIYAFGLAVLAKVILVMHEHFPRRYFKYVLIVAALALVARILVYLLRMVAFPRSDWLLKQYREAYEHFLCPVCNFPIRRGPLRFAFWNRRTIKKLNVPLESPADADGPYVCPVCGTKLFEECEGCRAIRHSLLPACAKCGRTQSPAPQPAPTSQG